MPRRNGLWVPPGTESVRSADTHEVMTVREYLQKPMAPVNRGELAAFCEALVHNQVRDVVQYVVDRRLEQLVEAIPQMIEIERRRRSPVRRLAAWWRGLFAAVPAGPVEVPVATPSQADAVGE